ncbi:hypothetical protein O6H91_15G051700 [Diphasiastrum complanatum]|uniref:Uncharacterized protein n=2 Tax=Diphasiastrum complanatum TaxID=34168 RepID=A0ACC2BI78_DIPCM|nr:hypothetical protein O6H91_15G051600 [Diphasiastrum complanatum]KAJ7529466.1 hypothetical protein O6H91_15G051700 [Diphasiastrum complanatum]
MSYDSVIGGKLKLKGKALDVKASGLKKKKKKEKQFDLQIIALKGQESSELTADDEPKNAEEGLGDSQRAILEDHRTAAEKKYDEQKAKLEIASLAKLANKSHRERIEDFNQYLANLSEHYDIPKVGPG